MKTNTPAFAQHPKIAFGITTAAIGSIATTAPTGLVELATVGADDAIITGASVIPLGTHTASSVILYGSKDGGVTKFPLDSLVVAPYTNSTSTRRPRTTFADISEKTPIRVPANTKIYFGSEVAVAAGLSCKLEYSDF